MLLRTCLLSLLAALGAASLPAQQKAKAPAPVPAAPFAPVQFAQFPVAEAPPLELDAATAAAIEGLLALQEGDDGDQWPYEGVYREDRGNLPIGYRVGGTAIVTMVLAGMPGYAADEARQAAVRRGLEFVLRTLDHERMQIGFLGTYDVRGWGHVYALTCLLQLTDRSAVPADLREQVAQRTGWLVKTLVATAIPRNGGWNYSRPAGGDSAANPASTFMTPPALQALFHAKARGHDVPDEVVEQALAALVRARSKAGGYAYGAPRTSRNDIGEDELSMMDKAPSATARAALCETTLLLAGRGDPARLVSAIELFFDHWDDLAVRKSRTGTHVKPYGIAPYYFLFGHVYCAQAIELLDDETQRHELRQRMRTVLARSRDANGTWNDRQFARSAGYGTALALWTLHMVDWPLPVGWQPASAGDAKDAK